MHDWTLKEININWTQGTVSLLVYDGHVHSLIRGSGLHFLSLTMDNFWGFSESIMEVFGPIQRGPLMTFLMEIQSGDQLHIEATSIEIFKATNNLDGNQKLNVDDIAVNIEWGKRQTSITGPFGFKTSSLLAFSCTRRFPGSQVKEVEVINNFKDQSQHRRFCMVAMKSGDRIHIEENIS